MIYDLLLIIYEASGEVTIGVNAAIAEEGPPLAYALCALEINVDDGNLLLCIAGLIEQFTLLTCHKATAPKLYASCCAAWVRFIANAVDRDDRNSVGDGVTALYGNPGFALALLFGR